MATTHPGLKRVGAVWHYQLRINGQRFHGSTRATDLPTAKKILEGKRREILSGQHRIITHIPTFSELAKEWAKAHQHIHCEKHLRRVEEFMRIWIPSTLAMTRLDHVTTSDVLDARNKLLEAGRSPVTANHLLRVIRLLFGYALKMHLIDRIPFQVKPLRVQRKPRPTVPRSKVKDFLMALDSSARNSHIPVMLRVMIGLGLRESEVLGMKWAWFNLDLQTYTVGKSKNRGSRTIPIPGWLWQSIHAMTKVQLSEYVFPAADLKPHRPQFCKRALQRVCEKLGIGAVGQHRLRATFASLHAEAGTPITEIQTMLGQGSRHQRHAIHCLPVAWGAAPSDMGSGAGAPWGWRRSGRVGICPWLAPSARDFPSFTRYHHEIEQTFVSNLPRLLVQLHASGSRKPMR